MTALAKRAAVLIIADTCSLLDLARHIERAKLPSTETSAAKALYEASLRDPTTLGFTVCEFILNEFNDHIDGVVKSACDAVMSLKKKMALADTLAQDLGLGRALTSPDWHRDVAERSGELARAIVAGARLEETTSADRDSAHARSFEPRRPASKGKPEFSDCVISEFAIRIADSRPANSTFLVSSNTDDYGAEYGHLHPDLAADFAKVGLLFDFTWTDLRRRLAATPC
jgi:hypothetical protein